MPSVLRILPDLMQLYLFAKVIMLTFFRYSMFPYICSTSWYICCQVHGRGAQNLFYGCRIPALPRKFLHHIAKKLW